MAKRRCTKGINLHYRWQHELDSLRIRANSPAEMARARMYQERAKRAEAAWKNHKQRCKVCMGVKSE